ncbi:MAG: ABC transporter ATP-binding protein [Omnitrophica bacterium]|nr:ABC transporter ATP-binding protein [Candidatus Omnitrophota bacterium]
MIIAKNVTKYFGGFKALKNVSFEIKKGEIVGFLGQNGAGKTTIMRILTSYLPATSGEVIIAGQDVSKNSLAIRRKIGYLPETPPLYSNMTVRDYLKFAAQLKNIPAKQQGVQIDKVLDECSLKSVQDKTIGIISKGYKQRVGIAQAILNDPEVLILDEPTIGLDPVQIIQVRNLIKSLEYKRTVILSTHILSEIQQIAQRVLIIKSGKIVVDETLENLLKQPGANLEDIFLRLHSAKENE